MHASAIKDVEDVLLLGEDHPMRGACNGDTKEMMKLTEILE